MSYAALTPSQPVDLTTIQEFRAENFPPSDQMPWLDRPDWPAELARRQRQERLSEAEAALCAHWATDGYVIVPGLFRASTLDRIWLEYEALIGPRTTLPDRMLNPHFQVRGFRDLLEHPLVTALVSLLLGAKALPFQTIAGHRGSEQSAHSDSIHMTTYPEGYLAANWIAFEDIDPEAGPLEYYPGSHRLPYVYSKDCGIGIAEGRQGYGAYHRKYEVHVQETIGRLHLEPRYFRARTGDVLFWHANLIHGGSRIQNQTKSRKALVCHYFAEGCVSYHDYTGRPSHLMV